MYSSKVGPRSPARSRSSRLSLFSFCALLMNIDAMVLPTHREPEWSTTQTRISVSMQTSTKWLPEPRVPSCLTARFTSSPSVLGMGLSRNHCSDLPERARPDSPRLFLPCSRPTPAGIERPNSPTSGDRSSGSSSRVLLRRTAIMPHPMSTPTAAGMMVSRWVGITLPTVAPFPMWASGIRATWPATPGARESISAWRRVPSSSMLAQFLTSPMTRTSRQSRRHVVSGSEVDADENRGAEPQRQMVGVAGLEPATSTSRTWRPTNWATPRLPPL